MEKQHVMNVNPLPSHTWHWLRMNESPLDVELPEANLALSFSPAGEGLTIEPDSAAPLPEIETGMGAEFDAAMSGTPAALIQAPAGYRGEPVVVTAGCPQGEGAGRLFLHAGADSELSVVLLLSEDAGPADRLALQVKICAEEGAQVHFCLSQLLNEEALCLTDIGAVCGKGAHLSLTQLNLGGEKQYAGIAVKLAGDESALDFEMGYRVRPVQSLDINYVTRHVGKRTASAMNAWGILEEKARKLFRGTIDFPAGCPGSKGQEKEEILLLGDRQINQTVPLILCTEEDVEGAHGATIGRLNEDMLFYLESRGVGREAAEELIARARLDAVCHRIPDEEVRSRTEDFIRSMSKGENTDEEF